MFTPDATSSGSLEARQRVAQLQAATKQVIALRRVTRSSYCDHSGWGYKQGRIIKTWKRRYFVLKGREVIYFSERSPSGKGIDEKGRFCINGVEYTVEYPNALIVRGELKNQVMKMQVDSKDESTEWFDKISSALQAGHGTHVATHDVPGAPGAGTAVAMKGWLLKEGQNFKTWKRRYMTLRGRVIQYRAQLDEKPLGETRVNAVNINVARPFALDIYSDNNRILKIAADSFAEIEAWDHALATAIGKLPCFGDPYAGQIAPFLGETFEESVLCEGWLYKRGQRSTEWQRRYFKLKGFELQYQDGPGESVPKGAGTVVGLKLGETGSNSVYVQLESGRVLCISADSQDAVDKWVHAICTLLDKNPGTLEKEVATPAVAASKGASIGNRLTRALSRGGSGITAPPALPVNQEGARSINGRKLSLACASANPGSCDDVAGSDDSRYGGLLLHESPDDVFASLGAGSASALIDPRPSVTGLNRKCGWLRKEGARVRSLKRRYFMVDGNKLYYFEQIGEAPRGNGVVKSAVPNDAYPNCLDLILTSGRTLRVVAESSDEIRSWLDHFSECCLLGDGEEECRSATERLSIGAGGDDTASSVVETGSGWLLKKGKNFKNWKRRFFKLEGKQLSYSSAPDAPPLGRGVVANVGLGNDRPFCLDVRFQNGRVMHVVAGNESVMVAWNRLLQAAVLTEPVESDLEQDTQFDFDDAEEDAHLDNMHTLVTAATAFRRGLSKASSTVSATSNDDGCKRRAELTVRPVRKSAEDEVRPTNERAGAAAMVGVDRRSLPLGSADTEEPVVCSGWLRKEGGTVKNWKRRYFTLHGTILCYFKSDNGALLRSFTVCHVVTLRTKKLCLEITTEVGRKLLVASETQADLDRWLDHLHRAIAAEKRRKHCDALQWTTEARATSTPLVLPAEASKAGNLA
ncbi:unnamed protein product [Hyaloperonospora brassicae]|uniref:PH domain-containing protein n=1 Tax=Hyaloperonospora brassicae TaxID=162125 RepID=A0AAV0UEX8_HYABA|nr:unnamed protein product [Hyaloperonospora brassicae]